MWVNNFTNFGRFFYLNIPCLRINITLIFMSSLSEEFTSRKQMFLLVSGGHTWRFIQSFINLDKTFFRMSRISIKYCTDLILGKAFCIFISFHFPDSRLFIFHGVTVQTEDMDTLVILPHLPRVPGPKLISIRSRTEVQ